ncbi:hypothetical protein LINPERHAP2_LOCUS39417 [Linum perenne]
MDSGRPRKTPPNGSTTNTRSLRVSATLVAESGISNQDAK